jgi:glycosyltransferase involved in cell wall biosynthesis
MASGAVPVACGTGGHADIVEHRRTGYLAAPGDLNDLADGIEWAMNAHIDRETLHDEVAKRFDASTIAQQYAALCGDQTNTSHTLK